MAPHLHLVPAGADVYDPEDDEQLASTDTNVVDLDTERRRRRYRYHPSAGPNWIDDLFDDDDDPLDPVC